MNRLGTAAWCAVIAALIAGTSADVFPPKTEMRLGNYHVLQGDFHVHSFPLSWATLGPFDTLFEARRQSLDVIAMTPQNHLWVAKLGRWFSHHIDGPIVLAGEEIHALDFHILGIGLTKAVSWHQSSTEAIKEVHRQGGVAIAAHPTKRFWSGYDDEAMRLLDGSEVLHPAALTSDVTTVEFRQFYQRKPMTAIADSDFHGLGRMGVCRTFVFARERTESGVLEALRDGHTVVYDRGRMYGDPELIRLAADDGRLAAMANGPKERGPVRLFSGVIGLLGLLILTVVQSTPRRADDSVTRTSD